LLKHRRSWGAVLATVLLFGSPYFIENLRSHLMGR